MFYICNKTEHEMAILRIYNDIQTEQDKRLAPFFGGVEGVCFKDVDEFCGSIPETDNEIQVNIHCDGGSVLEGWAIYDRLRASGKEITTIVEGNAASMATIVMMAAPKERRKAYQSAQICVHNPWLCPMAIGESATADDLQKAADDLRDQQQKIVDLYVERCGCTAEEIQTLMNEDKYIDTDRAMELGLIGEVILPMSAKKENPIINPKQSTNEMSEKVEVKASILNRMLAKLGLKTIAEVAADMELSAADGTTIEIEREEGAPEVGDKASPDGSWLMPDGTTIVIENGIITEIQDAVGRIEEEREEQRGDEDDGKLAELEARIAELEKKLSEAESNAKTTEDLEVLNAVAMAGGAKKVLASIKSDYQPAPRTTNDKQVEKAERNSLREKIEEIKNKKQKGK